MNQSKEIRPRIKATLRFIHGERRHVPADLKSGLYRPHIVIGDAKQRHAIIEPGTNAIIENYLGVQFIDGPEKYDFEEDISVEMLLMYFPDVNYTEAMPGKSFTLREGSRIAGFGTILERDGL